MRRLTAIAAAALTATACATIDKGVDKGAEVLSEAVLPTSSEVQLGNQLAGQVKTEEPVLKNDQVQAYVNRVGQRLARASASDRKGITYAAWREAGVDPAVLRRAGIRRAAG